MGTETQRNLYTRPCMPHVGHESRSLEQVSRSWTREDRERQGRGRRVEDGEDRADGNRPGKALEPG